jgi:hypothetical protein
MAHWQGYGGSLAWMWLLIGYDVEAYGWDVVAHLSTSGPAQSQHLPSLYGNLLVLEGVATGKSLCGELPLRGGKRTKTRKG